MLTGRILKAIMEEEKESSKLFLNLIMEEQEKSSNLLLNLKGLMILRAESLANMAKEWNQGNQGLDFNPPVSNFAALQAISMLSRMNGKVRRMAKKLEDYAGSVDSKLEEIEKDSKKIESLLKSGEDDAARKDIDVIPIDEAATATGRKNKKRKRRCYTDT